MGNRLPIRWRLTLWYVGLLALALALMAGLFYFGLRHLLYDALDSSLRSQATVVQRALVVENGQPRLPAPQDPDADIDDDDDRFVRLSDAQGRIISETFGDDEDDDDDVPANRAGVAEALDGDTDLRWLDVSGDRMRVLSQPIERDGDVVGALEVGIESEVEDTLGFALRLIAASAPLVLLAATLGGAWLARRALEPIDRMTRTAAAIGERDLSQRVAVTSTHDEVGRLATTLNTMLDRLEDAFRRQRRFTADAAHELRTPLALMQSQIELALAQPRDPDEDRVVLNTLAADLERMTRLAAALLDLAQSDSRAMALEPQPIDVPALLDLIAEQYGPVAEEAGVALDVDASPATVHADMDRLIQVLVNVLDNAMRHAPPDSAVTLGCRQEGDWARIWVADQGRGIPPEHLPHVFDRFYRVEPDRDRERGGIGLGLSIVRDIVEAHGGRVEIQSAPGAGTTVVVVLPSNPAEPGAASAS